MSIIYTFRYFTDLGGGPLVVTNTLAAFPTTVTNAETNSITLIDEPSGQIYGSQYNYAESLGTSTTTSSTFVEKLRLSTTDLPLANYVVSWYSEIHNEVDDKFSEFRVRIEQDDTTELGLLAINGRISNAPYEQWTPFTGFRRLENITGIHTFDIDFSISTEGTAAIRRTAIQLFRQS